MTAPDQIKSLAANGAIREHRRAAAREQPTFPNPVPLVPITAVLVAIAVLPGIGFADRSPSGRAAIETAAGVVAVLFSVLAAGRFRRTALRADLLTAIALSALGGSSLLLSALPAAAQSHPRTFALWAPAFARLLAGCVLAAAAWSPTTRVRGVDAAVRRGLALSCAIVGAAALVAWLLASDLPHTSAPGLSPLAHGQGLASAGALVVITRSASLAAYLVAAIGFARRLGSSRESFDLGIVGGAVLLAVAWLEYLVHPSLYPEWVTTGDAMRLAAYATLFAGAIVEIERQQRAVARGAVLIERRRISRDLHDGLAQELAHVVGQAKRLERRHPEVPMGPLVHATERALEEARGAISGFRAPLDEPLPDALERIAGETSRRFGIEVDVVASDLIEAPAELREALLRIAREALTNVGRHAQATTATVELIDDGRLLLRVRDDGQGFAPAGNPATPGFGLTGMRERAAALGGNLTVRTHPGEGTEIEAILP